MPIEALKEVFGLRKLAGEEAARAAHYVHPRQGYAGEDGARRRVYAARGAAAPTTSAATRRRKRATKVVGFPAGN